jgi:Kef-type K+ transport system membrane component KefB
MKVKNLFYLITTLLFVIGLWQVISNFKSMGEDGQVFSILGLVILFIGVLVGLIEFLSENWDRKISFKNFFER